jgi:rhodanese-related sulfurtransferase
MTSRSTLRSIPALAVTISLLLPACGDDTGSPDAATAPVDSEAGDATDGASPEPATGIQLVSTDEAATILADRSEDLVVLDIRTPEEYAEGHLEDATLIDFYADDFAQRLSELDPAAPYLLYCRSGNRSGQARAMMADLGFEQVADIDGGISAWTGAGLPITTD